MRHRLALVIPLLLAACSGGERAGTPAPGEDGGTLVIVLPPEPGTLMPATMQATNEKEIVDQIFDVLADMGSLNTIGDSGYVPRLASSWEWRPDSLSILFHLNPASRWHDGAPVTAADLRFSLELLKDPTTAAPQAGDLAIVDSISVVDSATAVAWFGHRSPEQFYRLVYNLYLLPEHLLASADRSALRTSDFARHPIGSGPFRFVRWETRSVLELHADSAYYLGRPHLDRLVWSLGGEVATAMSRVTSGEGDLFELVTPDGMAKIVASPDTKAVPFSNVSYGYLGFNLHDPKDPTRPHPLFGDRALRVALAHAIDRRALRTNVYDTLALDAAGPFVRSNSGADTTLVLPAYDAAAADRMLDSLGWRDSNGDGVRDRDGRALRFQLIVPASSSQRRQYGELIQAVLKPRGVAVDVQVLGQEFNDEMRNSRFDAVINSWSMAPSPTSVRANWYTRTGMPSFNVQGYSSAAFDATFDSAGRETDPRRARALFQRANRILAEDVPGVWLYEQKAYVAMHRRIRPAPQRADSWWRFLRLWHIPADERIDRDMPG